MESARNKRFQSGGKKRKEKECMNEEKLIFSLSLSLPLLRQEPSLCLRKVIKVPLLAQVSK
jgi:hypothetical protein